MLSPSRSTPAAQAATEDHVATTLTAEENGAATQAIEEEHAAKARVAVGDGGEENGVAERCW
jgi:hypothetical protein